LRLVPALDRDVGADEAVPDRPSPGARGPETAGEFLDASVAEDGGSDGMPARRFSQHQYRAVLHEAIVLVSSALDAHGVCDRSGRLRTTWLGALESLVREARAIDTLLGLPAPSAEAGPDGQATLEDFFRRVDRLV
jgi:hypothetical protein